MWRPSSLFPLTDLRWGLEYFSWPVLAGLFVAFAVPICLLARGRLSGIGPVRKQFIIGLRLAMLAGLLLILGGLRFNRLPSDVEVLFLRDVSPSTANVGMQSGQTAQQAIAGYIGGVAARGDKSPGDTVGLIRFSSDAVIDAIPQHALTLGAGSMRNLGDGTNAANAIQLALASLRPDFMHRFVLVWDGNDTAGDLDAALNHAAAQGVRIDVMPLRYNLKREVIVEHIAAPSWRREGEPFTLDVVIRSTADEPVAGTIRVTDNGQPLAVEGSAGRSFARAVTLSPGANVVHVPIPPGVPGGVHRFRAVFEAQAPPTGDEPADSITTNNSAEAFTFIRGRGRILYVDTRPPTESAPLLAALADEGITIAQADRLPPEGVPDDVTKLQDFDAVILSNVPRGAGGLDESQQAALAHYVHDLGGGLLMIGGPDAFGAGGWAGSTLEKILPLDMDIPARRTLPRGALVMVLDHSGSMGEALGSRSKQEVVNEAAVLSLKTLAADDRVGVLAFDTGFEWVVPLGPNRDADKVAQRMRQLAPGGGTSIYPGLAAAVEALEALPQSDGSVKHILLLTDGHSTPADYDTLLKSMRANGISLSTVGVGADHDSKLLQHLAQLGKGRYYPVNSPQTLPQVFIREARTVRRSLIHEDTVHGLAVRRTPSTGDWLKGISFSQPVLGMVLTSRKKSPEVQVPLVAGAEGDPLLAHWQTGLGRVAAFTSDATSRWAARYIHSPEFGKFWAQLVRGVARPPMSSDFDLRVEQQGERGHIVVEAISQKNAFINFATISGTILGPDGKAHPVRLVQSAPGAYTGDFKIGDSGVYAVAMGVTANSTAATLRGGLVVNESQELRALKSNDAILQQVADRTGGHVLPAWDVSSANVFSRDGLVRKPTPLPVWDLLLPLLIGLFLTDVAVRRLSIDIRQVARSAAGQIRGFTMTTRDVQTSITAAALLTTRARAVEETNNRIEQLRQSAPDETISILSPSSPHSQASPANDEPPADNKGDSIESLLEAKRRFRDLGL